METNENAVMLKPDIQAKPQLLDMPPAELIESAKTVANVLADVIDKQGLFVQIGKSKYVKVDGWVTLGSLIGVLPREVSVKRYEDGTYEAAVELYSVKTNQIWGRASAICAPSEKRWAEADEYARRSMSITRATGKAYRLSFGFIMSLSGYETTPAEEMPQEAKYTSKNQQHKTILKDIFEECGVKDPNIMKQLAPQCEGKTFDECRALIKGAKP